MINKNISSLNIQFQHRFHGGQAANLSTILYIQADSSQHRHVICTTDESQELTTNN